MALSSISGNLTLGFGCTPVKNMPASGLQLPGASNNPVIQKKQQFKTGTGAGQATEAFLFFVTISGGGSASFSLLSLTDLLQFTGIQLSRLNGIMLWLLSPTDDNINGTLATSVTVGNASPNPHALFLDSPSYTFTLQNGQAIASFRPDAAAWPVTAGAQNVKIVNNDGARSASVLVAGFGS